MELRLHSPVGAGREFDLVYTWPTDDTSEKYSEEDLIEEIRETISAVLVDHPGLSFRIPPIKALGSYEALRDLSLKWNASVDAYTVGRTFKDTKASLPQAQHIIGQVYNRSIVFPERLNQYAAFSSHVYGETSPKMVSHMIKQLQISEQDTFLDLGSGVGQVVLQMAAAANFKRCVGIETCEVPCEYAVGLQTEFQKTMKWYGKSYSEFRLYNGDFLDKKFRETIQKSSIIFANNFAFGPEVDHQLKEIFADLDDGVRIVSSKEFSAVNFRINQRNLSDIGTIMNVTAMKPFKGAVSWTNSNVFFFLHSIDRSKLERYFEESIKGHQQNGLPVDKSKRRSVKPSNDQNSEVNVDKSGGKPKKRTSRPKFTLKKKPKRSENSTSRTRDSESRNTFEVLSEVDVPNEVKLEVPPPLEKPKPSAKTPPPLDHSKSKEKPLNSKPPRKRKSELDKLIADHLNLSSSPYTTGNLNTSEPVPPAKSSQQVEDIYANAPWRNVKITSGPPKCVDELLARMRIKYFEMIDTMKDRAYVQKIEEDIRVETERNEELRIKKKCLEKVVKKLQIEGTDLLMRHLADLGYSESNWQSIFPDMQGLVQQQAVLSLRSTALKRDIAAAEQSISELLERHGIISDIQQQMQRKRLLEKTVAKLTCQLHQIEGKTPPSFPDSPNSDCDFPNDEGMHPSPLYVNDVRMFDRQCEEAPPKTTVSIPATTANESSITTQYKISPSSILPKKRR